MPVRVLVSTAFTVIVAPISVIPVPTYSPPRVSNNSVSLMFKLYTPGVVGAVRTTVPNAVSLPHS